MPQIFLDCDGVLADFDTYFRQQFGMDPREFERIHGEEMFWEVIRQHEGFFAKLPLMPDAMELVYAVQDLNPIILTGCSHVWGAFDKQLWRERNFPEIPMAVCRSEHKREHMQPGDILIDDWAKYRHLWEEAGGIFILHKSAKESIASLRLLGVLPPELPNQLLPLAEPQAVSMGVKRERVNLFRMVKAFIWVLAFIWAALIVNAFFPFHHFKPWSHI